jgi:hypothetical protein
MTLLLHDLAKRGQFFSKEHKTVGFYFQLLEVRTKFFNVAVANNSEERIIYGSL